tara:strand:+ start:11 stop:1486 length:1476 start_codon:yes stop_codon:yes gene_type:complete
METLQRTANRGSVSTGGYEISNSIMFSSLGTYADANSLFYNQIATSDGWAANSNAGTNARKLTVSCWFKRTALTESSHYPRLFDYRAGGVAFAVYFTTSDQLQMYDDNTSMNLISNQVFRDLSAWYHIVVQIDSTQATASDRVNVYINGEKITSWATEDYGNQNVDLSAFRTTGVYNYIGSAAFDYSTAFNGYIAEYHFIDGSTVAHTEFGETDSDSGIWKPKEYTGSYGTLGHYYNFSDSTDMGEDFSGNNNDSNNRGSGITNGAARQATDTPTNNFATFNPLWNYAYNLTISDGASKLTGSQNQWQGAKGSVGLQNGRWYWEVKIPDANNAGFTGIQTQGESNIGSGNAQSNNSTYCRKVDGNDIFYYGGSESTSSHGGGNMANDNIIGVFLDLESSTKTLRWFKNGSSYGSTIDLASKSTSFTTREVFPFYATYGSYEAQFNLGGYGVYTISSSQSDANGYGTFEYSPNDGTYDYYAICTKNLAKYGG